MKATSNKPSLRPAGALDAPLLAELHAECFLAEPWPESVWTTLLAQPGCFATLAERGGEPLGFALGRAAADECEVLTLGVRPLVRRQGIGRRLLEELRRQAAAAGSTVIYLEVASDNLAARALYAAAAFHESGRRKAYYHYKERQAIDALVLMRRL